MSLPIHRGMTFGFYARNGYFGSEEALAQIPRMKSLNIEWVCLVLDAVCSTFWNEPWWMGLYWWKWDEQNHRPQFHDDPRGDKGFTLWGKPAADTMKRWYGRPDRRADGAG